MQRTRTVYNFKNTCQNCFNDIELPLLGEYSEGEVILQTKDGQDFYIAELIENTTFDFIVKALNDGVEIKREEADASKVLTLLADRINGKEFILDYPICPICKKRLTYFTDNLRTTQKGLRFATWTDFESLTRGEKINRIKKVVQQVT